MLLLSPTPLPNHFPPLLRVPLLPLGNNTIDTLPPHQHHLLAGPPGDHLLELFVPTTPARTTIRLRPAPGFLVQRPVQAPVRQGADALFSLWGRVMADNVDEGAAFDVGGRGRGE